MTDTEFENVPPFGVIVGAARVNVVTTLRVNAVVLVTPPPVAVTMIGKLPIVVDPVVLIVNPDEHVAIQEAGEKEAVAPLGRPAMLKETA